MIFGSFTLILGQPITADLASLGSQCRLACLDCIADEWHISFILDVNECTMPYACPLNYKCKNLPHTYSCECTGGFKEIKGKGQNKKCVGKVAQLFMVAFSYSD